MHYRISLEGYQIICVRSFSQRANKLSKVYTSQYTVKITQKEHLLIWNSETTQNLNIYLYNYQTKAAIFLATKHEKICSYLKFCYYFLHFEVSVINIIKNENIHLNSWYHIHKKQKNSLETQVVLLIFSLELDIFGVVVKEYIKTAKNGSFCEELFSENDFQAVLANFCCHVYGANTSEAVQKIRTRTLDLYSN